MSRAGSEEGETSPARVEEYKERLSFELDTIIEMGFAGYFLIVADFIGETNFESHRVLLG